MTGSQSPQRSSESLAPGPDGEVVRVVQSGLPLASGLRACAEESGIRSERRNLLRMARRLEAGQSVDEAVTGTVGLPAYLRQLTAAGIRSGQLAQLLGDYLGISRRRRELQHKLAITSAYPLLILTALLFVGSVFPMWIVPQFKDIFDDFGVELPASTQLVIGASDLLLFTWPIILGVMFALLLTVWFHRQLPGRGIRQWILKKIPLFGSAIRLTGLSEFSLLLSMLTRAQLDLRTSLALLGPSLNDLALRKNCARFSRRLEAGDAIDELMHRSSSVPAEILHLFLQATNPQAMSDQLQMYGKLYAVQAEVKLRQALVLLEPICIVFAAVAVAGIMLSVLAPLINLLDMLS